ncbi:DUF6303 family protein [Streptomyces sp. NPDC047000]|uniref:DUF6303 family protein n=1 Tax=Streptomyces sp. NPDC047000 TaxID=3155474 RepID=UPI0034040430
MSSVTAQMSNNGGPWRLYVVLYGEPRWPEFRWEGTGPVPTVAERRAALAVLGYETTPGAGWSWCEDSRDPDDITTPVLLIAAVTVRPRGEVTS